MITVQIRHSVKHSVDKTLLIRAAQHTLDAVNSDRMAGLSIVIGDDNLLKKLNSKYRGMDTATDVLSFQSGEIDPDTRSIYLGDVIISLPRAQEQASMDDHSLMDELQLLVVHGTLHLLGYDHLERADKVKMQDVQDAVLCQLGVPLVQTME